MDKPVVDPIALSDVKPIVDASYTQDLDIPVTYDPMRAVLADHTTDNHSDGSCILFSDSHSQWALYNDLLNDVTNPHLPDDDTNIYADDAPDKEKDAYILDVPTAP